MPTSDPWQTLERTLLGEMELTGADVAVQSGIDFEQTRRLWRALGFPPVPDDVRAFTRADVAVLALIRQIITKENTDPDVFIQLTRVTSQSLARVAEAQVSTNRDLAALLQTDLSQEQRIQLVSERMGSLVPQLEPLLGYVWRRHLLAALMRLLASSEKGSPAGRVLAVGFADLVGFTAISQQLSEQELAAMVDRFEQIAYEQIPRHGGRVVKMIGDEVMFSVETAAAAAEIALGLVEAHATESTLPEVRAGVAMGTTLSWEGDLFGTTVNLASRLVNIARPGTALISAELAQALENEHHFTLRHLRPLPLKGLGRVRVTVLRRAASESVTTVRARRRAKSART